MPDRYEPRPNDHLVEPMFHALGTGDEPGPAGEPGASGAPPCPTPVSRALRAAALFALVGSVLLGTTFAYAQWGTDEPRALDAKGLGLPALLMACGSAVYLARAWRARASGEVGRLGLGLAVFSALYLVSCWAVLSG